MDENTATGLQQQLVELGDATAMTTGTSSKLTSEENPVAPWWIES